LSGVDHDQAAARSPPLPDSGRGAASVPEHAGAVSDPYCTCLTLHSERSPQTNPAGWNDFRFRHGLFLFESGAGCLFVSRRRHIIFVASLTRKSLDIHSPIALIGTKAASSGVVISTYRPSGPLRRAPHPGPQPMVERTRHEASVSACLSARNRSMRNQGQKPTLLAFILPTLFLQLVG